VNREEAALGYPPYYADTLAPPVATSHSSTATTAASSAESSSSDIPLQAEGGTLVVPALINNAITLKFVVDSGAADVSIPADVVLTLIRAGTVSHSDFLGAKTYVLANGAQVPSRTLRLRVLKVGDVEIHDVTAGIGPVTGDLLLGQSFLARFKSWSIDNQRRVLILER
jgi:predicted aspartyl protease